MEKDRSIKSWGHDTHVLRSTTGTHVFNKTIRILKMRRWREPHIFIEPLCPRKMCDLRKNNEQTSAGIERGPFGLRGSAWYRSHSHLARRPCILNTPLIFRRRAVGEKSNDAIAAPMLRRDHKDGHRSDRHHKVSCGLDTLTSYTILSDFDEAMSSNMLTMIGDIA